MLNFIIQRVKAHAIPCPPQPPTNGDNTISVGEGGIATPGATKQLFHRTGYLKVLYIYIYIYIYIYARSIKSKDYIVRLFSFLVQFLFTFGTKMEGLMALWGRGREQSYYK